MLIIKLYYSASVRSPNMYLKIILQKFEMETLFCHFKPALMSYVLCTF